MNLRPGRLIAIVIVGGWVTLLTLHLWQSYAPPTVAADIDLKAPMGANLTQRGVFYRGSKIGFIREKLTPLEDGLLAEQKGQFTLNVMGKERNLEIEGSAKLTVGGVLNEFSYRLTTASGRSPFETRVKGIVEGAELALTINSGDSERTQRRALDRPIVLPLNIYYSVAAQGLEAGNNYRLQLFDPMTLTEGEVEITVMEPEIVHWGGHEEQAYRLRSQFSGLTTTAWINEEGQILKEETPLGWTLLKEEPGSGLHARSASNVPEIVTASAIPAIGYLEHPEELTRVRFEAPQIPGLQGRTHRRSTDSRKQQRIDHRSRVPPAFDDKRAARGRAPALPQLRCFHSSRRRQHPASWHSNWRKATLTSTPHAPSQTGFTATFARLRRSRFPVPPRCWNNEPVIATNMRFFLQLWQGRVEFRPAFAPALLGAQVSSTTTLGPRSG